MSIHSSARALLALSITAAVVAGCATAAQRQYQLMTSNAQSAGQAIQSCVMAAYNSPEFAPLRPHLPLKAEDASLQQLSDTSFASDEEIRAELAAHPKFHACREAYLTQISQTTPSIAAIYATAFAKSDNNLVALIQRKVSWGEYLRNLQENAAETKLQITQESQRIVAGLNRSHEAELARRQAASNAIMQYYQTQQIINSMNRPVVTNCTTFGNTANCISH